MDIFLRTIAITIEVLILAAIVYTVLSAVRLTAFDLGINTKYNRVLVMALIVVGIIFVIFFIAHLTNFYPTL